MYPNEIKANGDIVAYDFLWREPYDTRLHVEDADFLTNARLGMKFEDSRRLLNTSGLSPAQQRRKSHHRVFLGAAMEIQRQYRGHYNGIAAEDLKDMGLPRRLMKAIALQYSPYGRQNLLKDDKAGHLKMVAYIQSILDKQFDEWHRSSEKKPKKFARLMAAGFWMHQIQEQLDRFSKIHTIPTISLMTNDDCRSLGGERILRSHPRAQCVET